MNMKTMDSRIGKIAPVVEKLYRDSQVAYFENIAKLYKKYGKYYFPTINLGRAAVHAQIYAEKDIIHYFETEKLDSDFRIFMGLVSQIERDFEKAKDSFEKRKISYIDEFEPVVVETPKSRKEDENFNNINFSISDAILSVCSCKNQLEDLQAWTQDGFEPDWLRPLEREIRENGIQNFIR